MAIVSHAAPFPPGFKPHWRDILEEYVALYRRMPEDVTLEVEALIPWFIKKIKWEWKHWKRPVSPEDKEIQQVCVACEACVLIARRSKKDYARMKTFIFLPRDLEPVRRGGDAAGDATNDGRVRQGWYWTKEGMEDGLDNYNLTLHEFGHILDCQDWDFDSVPRFEDKATEKEYRKFVETEYADICRVWERKSGYDVMREYATSDRCEFFTCATEAFFERAKMLELKRSRLYGWMSRIYRMDPAEWTDRVSWAELRDTRFREWKGWKRMTTWARFEPGPGIWPDGIQAAHYTIWLESEVKQWTQTQFEEKVQEREEGLKQKGWLRLQREERRRWEREMRLEEIRKVREENERQIQLEAEERERRRQELELLNNRTVVIEYPNGQPQLKYRLKDGRRSGKMQRWDEAGRLREETEFQDGRKHGKVVYFYASGQKELEGHHILNRRAGVWWGWHEDGTKSFRSEYREGELYRWKQYRQDGQDQTFSRAKNRFGR